VPPGGGDGGGGCHGGLGGGTGGGCQGAPGGGAAGASQGALGGGAGIANDGGGVGGGSGIGSGGTEPSVPEKLARTNAITHASATNAMPNPIVISAGRTKCGLTSSNDFWKSVASPANV
jgi:hypothetical protein